MTWVNKLAGKVFGPIHPRKRVLTICPNPACNKVEEIWSPTIDSVLRCSSCNTRLEFLTGVS